MFEVLFEASVPQMRSVYILISNHLNSPETKPEIIEILEKLIDRSIIFVPSDTNPSIGRLNHSSQVFWSDKTGLFLKYKPKNGPILLDSIYSKSNDLDQTDQLKQCLFKDFKIIPEPNIEFYISLLESISIGDTCLNDVYKIFQILVDKSDPESLFSLLRDKSIIPCRNLEFLEINQNPMIVDDELLGEKFMNKVNLVRTPDIKTEKHFYFLSQVLKLKKLSECIYLDLGQISNESISESPEVESTCSSVLPFIQYFLNTREEVKHVYTTLQSLKIGEKLLKTRFYSVKEVDNVYRLKSNPEIFVQVSNKYFLDLEENNSCWKFYVRADTIHSDKDVIRGFVKLFSKLANLNEKFESDLVNVCLLMKQFGSESAINHEDRKEIEKDHRVRLELRDGAKKWKLKVAQNFNEIKFREPVNKKVKLNNDLYIYESISRGQIQAPIEENLDNIGKVVNRDENPQEMNESLKEIRIGGLNERGNEIVLKVGRLGELWVNSMLKEKYKIELECAHIKIEWMNEISESGLPFDFKLFRGESIEFIEVKSTTKFAQEIFPISYNELIFAKENAENFFIYRLYNVNCENPSQIEIRLITDIPGKLNSHKANLFIFI